jgi:hypothetical protein
MTCFILIIMRARLYTAFISKKVGEAQPYGLSKNQSMGEIEVIFGSVSLICRDYEITERINATSSAMLRFDKSDFLALGAVNYLDEVVINSVSQKRRVFTGNIVSIKSEPNNQVLITLDNGVELNEMGISALTVLGVDHREVFYSMARLADIPKDKIVIPGLDSSVKEIVAFVPFKGLLIEQDEMVGEVQFLNHKSVQEKLPKTEKSEVWNGFLDADGWISFRFTSAHFADAENLAIERADVFLSAYSGLLQYGYSQFDGDFIEWKRTREEINLKRQNHILLVMPRNGAAWLRDLSPYKPIQTKLKLTINLDIGAVMDTSENFQLPLLVWNRFRDSEDYYVVTIGLWQVFELFSSGDKLPKRFTEEQLIDLSSRAVANLTEQEQKLVRGAIKKLNERALMEKLQKHLDDIGIVLSKQEYELLRTFREIRNAIEHGRKPKEPSVQEIKRVKALVNRVILATAVRTEGIEHRESLDTEGAQGYTAMGVIVVRPDNRQYGKCDRP